MSHPVVHIDATQCAKKGGRSGIPRVVRELARALHGQGATAVPTVWDENDNAFLRPHLFHRANLDPTPSRRPPRKRAIVPLRQKVWNSVTRPWRRGIEREFARGWVVMAETLSDGRIEWLERYPRGAAPFRRAAIFHDAIGLTHPQWIPPRNRQRFEAYLAALSRCDLVICISRQSEGDLRDFWAARGLSPAPTRVILLPATDLISQVFSPGPVTPPLSSGLPSVLCVASLEPRKNHLALLEACERLWDDGQRFRLVLVGQQPLQGAESIVAAIERCRAAGRLLDWRQEIDDPSLAALYRECAFTVYPSLKEGFGLPIVESVGFGKVCVCDQKGAIAEAAEGGGCLQVDVSDPQALSDAILRLLSDDEERQRLEAAASARHFISWKEWASSFLRLLQEAEKKEHDSI